MKMICVCLLCYIKSIDKMKKVKLSMQSVIYVSIVKIIRMYLNSSEQRTFVFVFVIIWLGLL
jgi:hypothetical protein